MEHELRRRKGEEEQKEKEKKKERRMKKKWRSSGRKRKSKKKKKKEEERNKKEKVRSIFKYARPPPPNLCLATNISKSLILLPLSPLRSVRKDDDSFYQAAAQ